MSNKPLQDQPESQDQDPIIQRQRNYLSLVEIAKRKGVVKYRYNNSYHTAVTIKQVPWTYARVYFDGSSVTFNNEISAFGNDTAVCYTEEKFTGYPDDNIPSLTKWVEFETVTDQEILGKKFSFEQKI